MREVRGDSAELRGVSAVGLSGVLDFIYTGELHLNEDNILEVIASSSHLQMSSIQDLCSQYLTQTLSMENIREVQSIAEVYQLQDLKGAAHNYVLQHFANFARTDYFKQLPVSEVCKLLRDSGLRCQSEFKIFRFAMEWIRYSRENRESLIGNIMKNIRLSLMTPEELRHLKKFPCINQNKYCVTMIDEALYFRDHPIEQAMLVSPVHQVRSDPCIFTFGNNEKAMHSCLLKGGQWFALDRALDQPRPFAYASATVVNNFLYVCGGQTTTGTPLATFFAFNAATTKWITLTPMTKPRRNFALVAHGFDLYAVGGLTRNEEVLDIVEKYSIAKSTWSEAPSLDRKAADLTACESLNRIYVAGGFDENCLHLKDFKYFDPKRQSWHKEADLLEIKFRPRMFAAETHLYLVDLYKTEDRYAALEQFDLRTRQWSSITLLGLHFSRCFSATILDDWIYFIGRNDVDDGPSKRYNIRTGDLEDIRAYPWLVESPLAVTLQVPSKILTKKMLTSFEFNRRH